MLHIENTMLKQEKTAMTSAILSASCVNSITSSLCSECCHRHHFCHSVTTTFVGAYCSLASRHSYKCQIIQVFILVTLLTLLPQTRLVQE